jgi:type I restriction enzyme S subunit
MKPVWKPHKLDEFLTEACESVTVNDAKAYRQVTVAMRGRGVRLRQTIKGEAIKTKKQYLARAGQFIYSRIDARNGAMGIVPADLDGALVTGDFPTFNLNDKIVDPRFFAYLVSCPTFIEKCKIASRGVTNRKRLKEPQFLSIEVEMPDLPEQGRLAARLDALSARLAEARRLHDELADEQQEFLLSLAREIAAGAPREPMQQVAPLVRRAVKIRKSESYAELGIRSFGKGTFHKPALTAEEVGSKRLFRIEPHDLLFSNVFSWEGAIAVVQPGDEGRFGSHRFITCVPKPEKATADFLCHWFLSHEGMTQIRGASPGAAGRNRTLGIKKLMAIPVPVPPLPKQEKFTALRHQIQSARVLHADLPAELDALQSALLARAFKGEL